MDVADVVVVAPWCLCVFEKFLKHPLRFPLSGYTQCAAIDHHVGGDSGADGPSTFNSSLVVEMLEMAYVS